MTESDVAWRIVARLRAWHAGAEPGEQTASAAITVLGPAGQPLARVALTYRQAAELAAWQAGVTSTTCTPSALAEGLRRWLDPTLAPAAATVVFARPAGSDAHPVALPAADAERFVTTLELGIDHRRMVTTLVRERSRFQRGQRVRVRDDAGGAATGGTGTIGWVTAVLPDEPGHDTTFWYDVHLDAGGAHPQTFTVDELIPLAGADSTGPA